MKKPSIAGAVAGLPKARIHAADVDAQEEKGSVRQTLYLPTSVHNQIRDAAHAKRISQQKLFRQALDLWFSQEGLPSWDELKEIGN